MRLSRSRMLVVAALAGLLVMQAQAQDKKKGFLSIFKDSEDGAFDVSDWLLNKKGFFLQPTLMTEPALDYGLGLACIWFHQSMAEKQAPPSMTGAVGLATLNGTWGAGVFHVGHWKGDRIRFTGVAIKADMNVAFWGSGNIPIFSDRSINAAVDTWYLTLQMMFRLGRSDFFAGAAYDYMPVDIEFETPIEIPEFQGQTLKQTASEISAVMVYDTRDNIFTPTKGFFLNLSGTYSDTWFGGERSYGRLKFEGLGYFPAGSRLNVGARYDTSFSLGDVPFWARPWVNLRGAPQVKYQNKNTATMEVEIDWNVYKRWSLLSFTGIGHAFEEFGEFDKGKTVRTIGAGWRYLLARKLGLQWGMDFAVSNDDFAFYIVFGSGWLR